MRLTHYPTLSRAFDLMLIDNVANPHVIKAIRNKVHQESLEPVGVFDRAEAELSKLSIIDLSDLCIGEEGDVVVTEEAQDVLTALFEMIC